MNPITQITTKLRFLAFMALFCLAFASPNLLNAQNCFLAVDSDQYDTVCQGGIIDLDVYTNGDLNTLSWNVDPQTAGAVTGSPYNPKFEGLELGTVQLTATISGNECSETSSTIILEVVSQANPEILNGTTDYVCENNTLELSTTLNGGDPSHVRHLWTLVDGPDGVDVSEILSNQFAANPILTPHSFSAMEEITYKLKYSALAENPSCDDANAELIEVTVRLAPDAVLKVEDNDICPNTAPNFTIEFYREGLPFLLPYTYNVTLSDGTNVPNYRYGDSFSANSLTGGNYNIGISSITIVGVEDGENNHFAVDCKIGNLGNAVAITVQDIEDPTIVNCPADRTVPTDLNLCTANLSINAPESTDNCGVAKVEHSINGGSPTEGSIQAYDFEKGETTITWTATDVNGRTSPCTTKIKVEDHELPKIECPIYEIAGYNNDAGECDRTLSFAPESTSDNCESPTLEYSIDGSDFTAGTINDYAFPVGTTLVIWKVTDGSGNTNACNMTIIVHDVEKPVATCATLEPKRNIAGLCGADQTVPLPNVTDNCQEEDFIYQYSYTLEGASIEGAGELTAVFPVGTTEVEWTAIDSRGNFSEPCIVSVTILDEDIPTVSPVDMTDAVADACEKPVTIARPAANDNCAVATYHYSLDGTNYTELTDMSFTHTFGVDKHTISWKVVDVNGKESAVETMELELKDVGQPTVTCPTTDINYPNTNGFCYSTQSFTLEDYDDNCLVTKTEYSLDGLAYMEGDNFTHNFPIGSNTVTWRVTDASGNQSPCVMNVVVEDVEAPVFVAQNDISVNDTDNCREDVMVEQPLVNDNCDVALVLTYSYEINGMPYTGAGNFTENFPVGVYTVTWTATDQYGKTATYDRTIEVKDEQAPEITCPQAITQNNDEGVCHALISINEATADDNCAVDKVEHSFNGTTFTEGNVSNHQFDEGETTVTWKATDIYGNNKTCIMTVTVNDTENPTLTCPTNVAVNTVSDKCGATESIAQPGSSGVNDNCDLPTTLVFEHSFDGTNFTTGAIDNHFFGATHETPHTVTWRVTDASSNQGTCAMTVTVTDNENPTIAAPKQSQSANNDFGQCYATLSFAAPSSLANLPLVTAPEIILSGFTYDACGIDKVEYSFTDADGTSQSGEGNIANRKFPVGTTDITWTVTDEHGNTNTDITTVTVNDNEDPKFDTPSGLLADIDKDNTVGCFTFVDVLEPSTTDNCGVQSVAYSYQLGDDETSTPKTGFGQFTESFPVGTTTITWTITDNSNNTHSETQQVKVTDTADPVFTSVLTTLTASTDSDDCETSVAVSLPATNDNCGVESLTYSYTINGQEFTGSESFTTDFPVGTTTITWTLKDVNGRSETGTQNVIVSDIGNPTFDENTLQDVTDDVDDSCSSMQTVTAPAASDACTDITEKAFKYRLNNDEDNSEVTGTGNIMETFPVGTTTITWIISDGASPANTATKTQKVIITDIAVPTISCPQETVDLITEPTQCTANALVLAPMEGVQVFDNCDLASITYSYTNAAGTAQSGSGNIQDVFGLGATTITWTASDVNGLSNTCTTTVNVSDKEAPAMICPAPITEVNDEGLCAATIEITLPEAIDNCGVPTVTYEYGSATGNSDISDDFEVGTTIITFTAVDEANNAMTCQTTVTVIDNENPTFTKEVLAFEVGTSTINVSEHGECTALIPNVIGSEANQINAADNCGIANITQTPEAGTPVAVVHGTQSPIEVVATDINGNTNTFTVAITFVDNTAPTVLTDADANNGTVCGEEYNIYPSSRNSCQASHDWDVPQFIDNCSVINPEEVVISYDGAGIDDEESDLLEGVADFFMGTTVVTYTATDNAEQSGVCSFTVNVLPHNDITLGFTVANPDPLNQLKVRFTSNYQSANSYGWDFGDGLGGSILSSPTYTYQNFGEYEILLQLNGCVKHFATISVSPSGVSFVNGGQSLVAKDNNEQQNTDIDFREENTPFIAPQSINAFPNPTQDVLNIALSAGFDQTKVNLELLDMQGRRVEQLTTEYNGNSIEWQLGHLAKGTYLLRAFNEEHILVHKVSIIE